MYDLLLPPGIKGLILQWKLIYQIYHPALMQKSKMAKDEIVMIRRLVEID